MTISEFLYNIDTLKNLEISSPIIGWQSKVGDIWG